ncbi:MAG TPA: DNRLRE domain-containing protein [Bacteroidota bacterium]|nr:DNRLRE domain-containing protein [Bacteroidota bacterium]
MHLRQYSSDWWKRILPFAIVILPAFFLLTPGCSDDPSELGKGLISPNDALALDMVSVSGVADTSFLSRVSTPDNDLVGIYQDLEARAVMQFSGFTSISSSSIVDSAVLVMSIPYRFLDTVGTLSFTVHEMLNAWSQSTFTWDTSNIPSEYSSTPDTTVLTNIVSGDTALSFHIDHLVQKWVQNATTTPDGIILLPSQISSTLIVGSITNSTVDTRPRLRIYYRTSVSDTTTDSLILATTQRAFVAHAPQPNTAGDMFSQAGISYRCRVQFDSLHIPTRASIARAIVQFSLDAANSETNVFTRDSLVVQLLRRSYYPFDSLAYATICAPTIVNGQKIYQGNITQIVQEWITREPNYGLVIRAYGESTILDRFALYNSSAAAGLKPRLIITYTVYK